MVVPPYICGCQEIFWICVTKRIWYADHTTVLACPQQLPEMPKYEVSGRRFGLPTSEVGLSSAAVRKCARPYRSRADEAVKCCRVCRDEAFLADEVIHYSKQELWEVSSARCDSGCDAGELSHYWLAFRFTCSRTRRREMLGLLEHASNVPLSALKSRRSCYGLSYGGSRRGRYRRHRRKRFYRRGGDCR